MKQVLLKVSKRLTALLLCAVILIGFCPVVNAAPGTVEMKIGTTKTFEWNASLGVGYRVISYGPATSSNEWVASVSGYHCGSSGLGYMNVRAKSKGTAVVSCPVTLYYGEYDYRLGYWREDTQYLVMSWKVEVVGCSSHNYSKQTVTALSTCTDGRYKYSCTECDEYYYKTEEAPHAYGDAYLSKAPTPTQSGTLTRKCSLCGKLSNSSFSTSHAVKITAQPADAYAKVGSTAEVSVAATGDELKYQWYTKNYGASSFKKSSVTESTYSVSMTAQNTGRQVYCVVTDKYGNTEKSNVVTLYSDSLIKTQPKSSSTYRDDKATATVKAVGQGLQYQWYVKDAGASGFSKSSVTSRTYSCLMDDARAGRKVYCVVTDQNGNKVRTSTVTLSMKPDRPVFITRQPVGTTVYEGETASVSVKATGKDMTYQWYVKNAGASKFSKSSTKTATYSITMNADREGRQVYCMIKDAYGYTTKSETVTLKMKHPATITGQPVDTSAVNGSKVSVKVSATGDGLKYQWYVLSADGAAVPSKATSRTYSAAMNEKNNGRQVYCAITDKYGNQVQSETVTLSMSNKIEITQQPTEGMAENGQIASVTVEATGEGLTYQWYVKNPGASKFSKSSVKTATYSVAMDKTRHGRQVYCVITDQYGLKAKTEIATLSMIHDVVIQQQPVSVSAINGETAIVSVAATGVELTYQWFAKNSGESEFTETSVTTPDYAVTMSEDLHGCQVYCVITDALGLQKTSETAIFSSRNHMEITRQPESVTAVNNEPVSVTVNATGEGLTYRWYVKKAGESSFNESAVTTDTYSVTMTEVLDKDQIYCEITNAFGDSVRTDTIWLYYDSKPITWYYKNTNWNAYYGYCGDSVSATVNASGDGLTYQWYYKDLFSDSFKKAEGETESTYSFTMQESANGREAYCIITDAYGNTAKTKEIQFLAYDVVTIVSKPSRYMYGDRVELEVEAVGVQLRYEWTYSSTKWGQPQEVLGKQISFYDLGYYNKVTVWAWCNVTNRYGASANVSVTINPQ